MFSIWTGIGLVSSLQGKIYYSKLLTNDIFVPRKTENLMRKKTTCNEDGQTLADLSSAHHRLQAKYQLVQTTYST